MEPATMPPTTAAIKPATSGAPDAMAIPSERGSATRKTTSEAGRSYRRLRSNAPESRRIDSFWMASECRASLNLAAYRLHRFRMPPGEPGDQPPEADQQHQEHDQQEGCVVGQVLGRFRWQVVERPDRISQVTGR